MDNYKSFYLVFLYSKESLNPFQNWFVSKTSCKRFLHQKACERVLFYKVLIPSSFKSVTLKRLWENRICLRKLRLTKREMNLNQFENKYQNPFDLNSFLKWFVLPNKGFPKDFGLLNLSQRTNLTWNTIIITCSTS